MLTEVQNTPTSEDRGAAAGPAAWRPPAWLPNAITLLRVALVPVFLVIAAGAAAAAEEGRAILGPRLGAAAVLVAIGLSDVVDGHLARKHGLSTPLGALLDLLADKLAQISLLVFFTLQESSAFPPVPIWLLGVALGRDLVLATGSLFVWLRRRRVGVEHQAHGRLFSVLVFALLLWITLGLSERVVLPGAILVVVVAVPSGIGYVREGVAQWLNVERASS